MVIRSVRDIMNAVKTRIIHNGEMSDRTCKKQTRETVHPNTSVTPIWVEHTGRSGNKYFINLSFYRFP